MEKNLMLLRRLSVAGLLMLSLGGTVTLIPQIAQAQTPQDQPSEMVKKKNPLNLTPEQKEKLKQIAAKYQPQLKQHRQDIKTARTEMENLMNNASATNEQLQQQHQKVKNLQNTIENLSFAKMLEERTVYNMEQRNQIIQKREQQKQEQIERRQKK
jgi:Spy/CpxP family protein refolding chaperone